MDIKFSSWLMVNTWIWYFFIFSQLLNLHPCCRIRATKCVQRTIALYQYKLFNLFPFSVIEFFKVVMFKPWAQCVIEIRESFFFLATCAISFRMMTLYFTMWVNNYSAKDSVYLFFARSQRSALFIIHGQIYNKGNQAQCDCSFFSILS